MITVRCSSLDSALACAGSLEETESPYNPNSPEANEGRAGHQACESIALGTEPDLDAIAGRYGVDRDVLCTLVARGRQAWSEVEQWFGPSRRTEYRMESGLSGDALLRGSADVIAVAGADGRTDGISILDWKLGHSPSEHPNQLRGYAYLARELHGMPPSGYILGVEAWVRVGELRVHRFDDADLDRLRTELLEQVGQRGKQFGPGPDACRYCRHVNHCAAREEWVRGSVASLVPVEANQAITRETVGAMFERVKQLEGAIRRYHQVVDAMLAEGPIALPDGRRLELVAGEEDRIVPSKARRWLDTTAVLTSDELDACLRISKSALSEVIKVRAGKGKGAAAVRAALAQLDELDAIVKVAVSKKRITGGKAA